MKKKKILHALLALIFLLTLSGAFAVQVSIDGFEDGDYTNSPTWTNAGTSTVDASYKYEGTYGLQSTGIYLPGLSYTDANYTFWFNPRSIPGGGNHAGLIFSGTDSDPWTADKAYFAFDYTGSGAVGRVYDGDWVQTGTAYDTQNNTWYQGKISFDFAGDDVYFYIYDTTGALLWSSSAMDNFQDNQISRIQLIGDWAVWIDGLTRGENPPATTPQVKIDFNVVMDHNSMVFPSGVNLDCNLDTMDVNNQSGTFSSTKDQNTMVNCAFSHTGYDTNTMTFQFDVNKTLNVRLKDSNSPTVSAPSYTGFQISGSYIKGTGNISAPINDNGSGIQYCEYLFQDPLGYATGDQNGAFAFKNALTIASGNTYTARFKCFDYAGNFAAGSAGTTYTADVLAPTSSAIATQRPTKTDANISITCSDAGVGCKTIAYKVDSNSWTYYSGTSTSFLTFGGGDHNLYYYSSDNFDTNEATKTLAFTITPDTVAPTITFSTTALYGFTSSFSVNFSLNCVDDRNDLMRYDVNRNDTNNVYTVQDYNNATKTGTVVLSGGWTTLTGSCTDASGNQSTEDSNSIFAILFKLVNESTGAILSYSDVNSMVSQALAYTYDGNYSYDFNATATSQAYFFSSSTVVRFDFTYKDADETRVSREVDFEYLDANANIGICLAPFQQFYEQIFVSSQIKPVIVYNDFAKCYNLASSTKFAYENALSTKALTIAKPYYVYTYSNGVKSLLALIDGTVASVINIDVLEFNQNTYDIALAYDTVVFQPLFNSSTGLYDTNTIQIFYKSLKGTNTAASFNIYNGATLLWSYAELTDFDEFLVSFYYGDMNISDANMLRLELTITNSEGTTTTDYYFTITGASYQGLLNPFLALLLAFGLLFVGLTLVAYRYAMGWFGLILGASAIGILALAPGYWYIRFAQAIVLIIIVFIVLIYKSETVGIN